ncbi:7-cyano-7-deazaguanine reductase [Burkholderiaceae bacterium]
MSHGSPNIPTAVPLGKDVSYPTGYDASLLFPMLRIDARRTLGLAGLPGEATTASVLPFQGFDLWNAYELSWLNAKGLPKVALLRLKVPCTSPNIVESKSFKLYLNSFNQTRFETVHHVFDLLRKDLALALGAEIELELVGADQFANETIAEFVGVDLDKLDVEIDCYQPDASLLKLQGDTSKTAVASEQADIKAALNASDAPDTSAQPKIEPTSISETVFSRLLKSNCPVTDQPDWACIEIQYKGPAIDHASLLKYIVSYRMHNGFHEHCVEKIFIDILKQCSPTSLSVYARYTRRGGLDINPWRATVDVKPPTLGRSARQ